MAEKRGRLRNVSIRPSYDEKGKLSGHTVAAEHDSPESSSDGNSPMMGGYMRPAESLHETPEGAMDKAKEHVMENHSKMAKKAGRSMKEAIG